MDTTVTLPSGQTRTHLNSVGCVEGDRTLHVCDHDGAVLHTYPPGQWTGVNVANADGHDLETDELYALGDITSRIVDATAADKRLIDTIEHVIDRLEAAYEQGTPFTIEPELVPFVALFFTTAGLDLTAALTANFSERDWSRLAHHVGRICAHEPPAP